MRNPTFRTEPRTIKVVRGSQNANPIFNFILALDHFKIWHLEWSVAPGIIPWVSKLGSGL